MKNYIIKIYSKRAGQAAKLSHDLRGGSPNKEAFSAAREELIRIAHCDLNRGLSESSESEILAEIAAINNRADSYYHDQRTSEPKPNASARGWVLA